MAVYLPGQGTFEAMFVKIRLLENRISQSSCLMNLAFGLVKCWVKCEINCWKALPLADTILSFFLYLRVLSSFLTTSAHGGYFLRHLLKMSHREQEFS